MRVAVTPRRYLTDDGVRKEADVDSAPDGNEPAESPIRPAYTNALTLERRLRQVLSDVRLVAEVDLEGVDYEHACLAMQELVRRRLNVSIGTLYPATTAFYLVAEGVHRYHGGRYWPELTVKGIDQTWMGPAFIAALKELTLPPFELETTGGFKYIAKILFHGGIPRYCAADVLRRLIEELRHGAGDAQEIVTKWRQSKWDLVGIDIPARRFLLHGGDEAVDLIDRIVELVQAGAAGTRLGPAEFGLPAYLVAEYEALNQSDRRLTKRARAPRPTLQIDPYSGEGPELDLPRADTADWFRWNVRSGGGKTVRTFDVTHHRSHRLPVDPPGPWTIEVVGRAHRVTHEIRGPGKLPVLIFDSESGELLRDQERLRADRALAIAPEGFAFRADGAHGADVPEREALPPMHGQWSRYRVLLLDLNAISSLWIGSARPTPGMPSAEAVLTVTPPSARPRIHEEPIPDVEGPDGSVVFGSWPTIVVPSGTSPGRWRYRAVVNGSRHEGVIGDLDRVATGYDLGTIGKGLPLATVDLDILGPLGSDLRSSFAVVEGLAVSMPDRVLGPSEPFDLQLDVATQLRIGGGSPGAPSVVNSTSGREQVAIATLAGDVTMGIAVSVPRLSWSLRRKGVALPFNDDRLAIAVDEIGGSDDEAILIRTVRPTSARLLLVDASGECQSEGPVTTQGRDGRWAFPLGRLLTTARMSDASRLQLVVEVERQRRYGIGELLAHHEVADLKVESLVEDSVTLLIVRWKENRAFHGRELRLWSTARPWDPPKVLPIPDSARGLLETVVDDDVPAGAYTAEVAVADGWTAPKRPAGSRLDVVMVTIGNFADVEARLRLLDAAEPQQYLELLLADRLPSAACLPGSLTTLYPALVLALVDLLEAGGWRTLDSLVVKRLREVLFEDPDHIPGVIDQLVSDGRLSADTVLQLSILTLTDALDCPLVDVDGAARARLFRDAPVLAMALDKWLPDEAGMERWRRYLGWAPPDTSGPSAGGPVQPFMLEWKRSRIVALRDALDPSEQGGLDHDGFVIAMLEWLANESPSFSSTSHWCNAHHGLNDRRVRQDPEQAKYLASLDAGTAPHSARFPQFLLAAAFHAVSYGSQSVKACRALLEAVRFAPALVRRSLLIAILSHRGGLK